MDTEIIVAILGFIGILVSAAVGIYNNNKNKHKAEQAEAEMRFQRASLDFGKFMHEWSDTHQEILHLLETTEIDRFLLLRAWNGALEPRWTTAVFQIREQDQTPVSYVHFELDTDYQERLRIAQIHNGMAMSTKELPECGIKSVYEAEGVKAAFWSHIESLAIPNTNCHAVTYCSFGSTKVDKLSTHTITACKILTGRLKGLSSSFDTGEYHD
jgi:hypothetical protein